MLATLEAVNKLSKDIKQGGATLGKDEARFLVDTYYNMQDFRITTANQIRSITKSETEEPHETIAFFGDQFSTLESSIQKVLDVYTMSSPVGRWCRSITGVGPVITAGLLAALNVEDRPTAGHFWSYCGINDNNRPWLGKVKSQEIVDSVLKGKKNKDINIEDVTEICRLSKWRLNTILDTKDGKGNKIFVKGDAYKFDKDNLVKACSKMPYNKTLKILTWKLGESFVKVSNNPNDFYGKIYQERKALEQSKNERLEYKAQADAKVNRVGKSTEAYKYYSQGMLPPAQIQARAKRYAIKIFLSHLHTVMYFDRYGVMPPKPFAIEHCGHAHYIEVPNKEIVGIK